MWYLPLIVCLCFQHVICTGLWCKVEGEKECKTKLDPPMDGTDCDPGKVSHLCCLNLISILGETWETCLALMELFQYIQKY